MSAPVWLLPDAEPVGPWLRAQGMLAQMPPNRLPFMVFRAEPDVAARRELDDLGVGFCSLGKKGLNPVASWWKLRSFLEAHGAARVHVWDLADLAVTVLATKKGCQISCEVSQDQVMPWIFRWWKQGLDRVREWYCQGQVPWVGQRKKREVGGWAGVLVGHSPTPSTADSDLQVLLVVDSPGAVREGLWAFDIFKHAWPEARLIILASSSSCDVAKDFAGTLGMANGIQTLQQWKEVDALQPVFAVVVLGSGPWAGDAGLRSLSWGVPVFAEDSWAVRKAITLGAPIVPVAPGDRAGLAAALQKIALGNENGIATPFVIPSQLSGTRDLPSYLEISN